MCAGVRGGGDACWWFGGCGSSGSSNVGGLHSLLYSPSSPPPTLGMCLSYRRHRLLFSNNDNIDPDALLLLLALPPLSVQCKQVKHLPSEPPPGPSVAVTTTAASTAHKGASSQVIIIAGVVGALVAVVAVFALYVARSRRRANAAVHQPVDRVDRISLGDLDIHNTTPAGKAPCSELSEQQPTPEGPSCVSVAVSEPAESNTAAAATVAGAGALLPALAGGWCPMRDAAAAATDSAAAAPLPVYATAMMAFAPRASEGSVSDVSATELAACRGGRQTPLTSSDGRPSSNTGYTGSTITCDGGLACSARSSRGGGSCLTTPARTGTGTTTISSSGAAAPAALVNRNGAAVSHDVA